MSAMRTARRRWQAAAAGLGRRWRTLPPWLRLAVAGLIAIKLARWALPALFPPPEPRFLANPQPRERYRLQLSLERAPGGFALVDGAALYGIDSPHCMPPRGFFSGARQAQDTAFALVHFERDGRGGHRAVVAADGFLDSDVYGRGVCRLRLAGVSVRLRASPDPRSTHFRLFMPAQTLRASGQERAVFLRSHYPLIEAIDAYPDLGLPQADRTPVEQRAELFAIVLQSKELTP
ncbi:hypothetical protein ABU614_09275 [Lysobacter firmicutimachus]|uniref:Exosortase-associated EpsI family protein n=1 Tax=Lysobacter firmicutimachus TaxID=1792846 RepID=A0AAU8MZ29_9GAMM